MCVNVLGEQDHQINPEFPPVHVRGSCFPVGNLEKQHSHHWDDGKWCFPSPSHWGFLALIKKSPNQTSLYSTPSPTTLSSKLQSAPSILLGSAIHQVLLTTWFMRGIGRSREIRGFAAFLTVLQFLGLACVFTLCCLRSKPASSPTHLGQEARLELPFTLPVMP